MRDRDVRLAAAMRPVPSASKWCGKTALRATATQSHRFRWREIDGEGRSA
jgi:hypothetical protein